MTTFLRWLIKDTTPRPTTSTLDRALARNRAIRQRPPIAADRVDLAPPIDLDQAWRDIHNGGQRHDRQRRAEYNGRHRFDRTKVSA